ncbi:hypothetical protein BU14_0524s0003 [Porphyra umbilicalis]|uniref:UBC core domain-containing protein n=1 Tax=Porphyra umbilicalis TaxID=2786 RepID=A0A1X6NSM1_PORUM|nr:hypothetical protein BU14_0524s0003 [Porphyra umbilicalis]|eukprot:OSX71520.1 hypothetical protein BU14_0524s0003 [Porphyra umbilicalis]
MRGGRGGTPATPSIGPSTAVAGKWTAGSLSGSANRIQIELQTLSAATSTAAPGHLPAFMAGPNGADLYAWTATVSGPSGSPYSRGLFFFDIRFPGNYPFSPPVVVLRSRIYHPNLVAGTTVAIRTLSEDGWSAATTVYDVLRGIRELLAEPDPHDAVVGSVAEQYVTDRKAFDETARDWTRRFAS